MAHDGGLVTRKRQVALERNHCLLPAHPLTHSPNEVVSGAGSHEGCPRRDSWASKPRLAVVEIVVGPDPGLPAAGHTRGFTSARTPVELGCCRVERVRS